MVAGRLSFFVKDIKHKTYNCDDQRAKQKQGFPSYVHWHHLPLSRKAKRFELPQNKRKQPHRYGVPTGFRREYYSTMKMSCQDDNRR